MEIKTKALLLAVFPFREKDAVLHFLCEDYGFCPAMARGFFTSRRRFGFAVDYFNLLSLGMKQGRGDMYSLAWAEPLKTFDGIRSSLTATGAGMMLLAVVRWVAGDAPANRDAFNSVVVSLSEIEQAEEPWSVAVKGVIRFLEYHGIPLKGQACASCNGAMDLPYGISNQGMPVCKNCCDKGCRRLSQSFLGLLQGHATQDIMPAIQDLEFFLHGILERPVDLQSFLGLDADLII